MTFDAFVNTARGVTPNPSPPGGGGGGGLLSEVLTGEVPPQGPDPYPFIYHCI